ncbi:molybdate ABC transporter substrate-binding protein [Microbacterium immunditiarum]|uniref:Molybdate transport system substrate-binding protein n=1 Tax=Microbacterium immunditiarum TaxID=337480 RepID=A0A7Y9KHC5_9MICO|nr:molybdate ABC transporter substrate-binding protein [Microbacterium immunditiarum]NYE19342.1 molybdate transport system substrate-binding protein [Microbacterium immunditiarum]
MRIRRRLAVAGVAASVVALLTACASTAQDPGAPTAQPSEPAQPAFEGELTIFAAASLKSAFDELAVAFEAANPGVDVLPIVYDGSSTLVAQLIEGASADVFASADENNMQKSVDAGLAADPQLFATNTLVVAVPEGNPGGVEDLSDLADDGITVVLCAPEVPCGAASQRLLESAGVSVSPASYEQNVTAVLTKVAAGEADAGLVYATDVKADPDVDSFVPEGAADVVNQYPIVALDDAANPEAAAAFVAFVLGPEGQAVLAEHGFGAP